MAPSNRTDPVKCRHYAQFASHLQTHNFDIIYWLLFGLVLVMLFLSSWYYGRCIDAVEKFSPSSPQHRRQMKRCMLVCALCLAISVVSVVMETFALLALQFCDGEDLLQLYWSTFTMTQIGSVVAVFGVMLSVWHSLRGRKHPPWALALGTPVLVIAGLGHFLNAALHRRTKGIKAKAKNTLQPGGSMSLSESPTQLDEENEEAEDGSPGSYNARLVGYTPDGGPIIQFTEEPKRLDKHRARVIGTDQDGAVTVAFGKEMQIFVNRKAEDEELKQRPDPAAASAVSSPAEPPVGESRVGSVSDQTLA